MTKTIKTETRPGARPVSVKPKNPARAPLTAARQKSVARPMVARPAVALPAKPPAPASKRRSWPIMEAAVILVLIKIAAGVFYIWNRPDETGREALKPPLQSGPAWLDPALTVADETPEPAAADYLAAALKVTRPALAQAAPAPAAVSALSAGALMVVGAQNAAIPLPPDDDYLWQPATQLPQATLPLAEPSPAASPAVRTDFEALRKIREREQELARREAFLSSRDSSLRALEEELSQRRRDDETVKRETETMLQRNEAVLTEQKALAEQQQQEDDAQKEARLKHLVTAYSGMKAEQAGSLINSMDDDVAVAILSAMPGGKAGKILAMTNPDKAARLTKAISEKRIDPNTLLGDEEAGGE